MIDVTIRKTSPCQMSGDLYLRHTTAGRKASGSERKAWKRSEMRRTGVSLTQRNSKKNGPFCYGEVDPRSDFSGEVVIAPEGLEQAGVRLFAC